MILTKATVYQDKAYCLYCGKLQECLVRGLEKKEWRDMKAKDTLVSACSLCSSAVSQAEISFEAGKQEGRQEFRREFIEWADEPCPHGTLTVDTSKASRRECDLCWQAKLKEWG